jgi:predicted membrane channel-forming protein YqfA (hemolysin III family)
MPSCSCQVSNLLLLLDYAGISILIGGSFLPPIFYGFYCDTHLRNVYLALISVLSLFSCFVGLYSGIWPNVHLKFVRVVAYRSAQLSLSLSLARALSLSFQLLKSVLKKSFKSSAIVYI